MFATVCLVFDFFCFWPQTLMGKFHFTISGTEWQMPLYDQRHSLLCFAHRCRKYALNWRGVWGPSTPRNRNLMLYTQSHRGRKIEHPVVFLVRSATNHAPNLKNDANPIFGEASHLLCLWLRAAATAARRHGRSHHARTTAVLNQTHRLSLW
jgi:hypothetical protein